MSVEAIAAVLHHSKASGTDKVVLIGIANHEGDGGSWPAVSTLAKYAQCSERAVRYALKRLVAAGELTVSLQAGGNENTRADRRPNLYRVTVSCPTDCAGGSSHKQRGERGFHPLPDGGQPASERGEAGFRHGVKPTAPEPYLEPSKNHPKKRPTSMTEGWQPNTDNLANIRKKHPTVDLHREMDNFRDYYISKGEMRVDWDASLRSWVRKAEGFTQKDKKAHTPTGPFAAGSGGVYQ